MGKKKLFTIFSYIIYFGIWSFVFLLGNTAYKQGVFSVFYDYYGSWFVKLGLVISIIVFLAPLYLRLFVKRETKIILISVCMTIVFLFTAFGVLKNAESHFQTFSTELWEKYPRQRILMYDHLKSNPDLIIGKSPSEVTLLLGEPDFKDELGLYYSFDYGDIIILFENGLSFKTDIIE